MHVYNFGSINIDHVYRVPHLVQPGETLASTQYQQILGGKGANQSIALARAGIAVRHIGRYQASDHAVLQPLWEAGVDGRCLQAVEAPSGHAIIQVDAMGENAIVLFAGANHDFVAAELPTLLAEALPGDWLLLQNECSCTREMMQAAIDRGMQVAFNPAPMEAAVLDLPLDRLSVLFVNRVEVMQLLQVSGDQEPDPDWLAGQLHDRFPDTRVVVTLGSRGGCCFYRGQMDCQPAYPVTALDTTGAGDTFIGYFLHALMTGRSVSVALDRACKASALCVQRVGASSSIPDAAEVERFEWKEAE